MESSLYGEPIVHRVPWGAGHLEFSTYEIGIILRQADGQYVPDTPVARALIERLTSNGIDPRMLLDAILAIGVEIPIFDEMDALGFRHDPDYQAMIEAILVEHLDRWREIDDPDGAHTLRPGDHRI